MKKINHSFSLFIIIWIGDLVSTIGSGLTTFSLGVDAFEHTGEASSATMIILWALLPAFLVRPLSGVLADRVNRLFLMILGNVGSAISMTGMLLMMMRPIYDLQWIYTWLALSSVFFGLQNPAYKASVSDFLSEELYAKASGLTQLSSASQFLLAPLLGGFLYSITSLRYIILIDIFSFSLSAIAVIYVKYVAKFAFNPASSATETKLFADMLEGWGVLTKNRGILMLVSMVSLLLFFIGLIQALLTPMVLAFSSPKTLGFAQSICAIGMLLASLAISFIKRKHNNVLILTISLGLMGVFFSLIGIRETIWAVIIPGFLFFVTIPFANSSIDVLIRKNIDNTKQGRIWSLISVATYLGSMAAYAVSGFIADRVFNPLLLPESKFAASLGHIFGIGKQRGISCLFFICGVSITVLAVCIFYSKVIQTLDATGIPNAEPCDLSEVPIS